MARRFRMISCEVSQREVCAAVARSRHIVDVDFLPKGLHDLGSAAMSERLRHAVDAGSSERVEAVLLWYGLCNNGLCGVRSFVPMVVPRAHDCLTLLLGSRLRFDEYFSAHPGTFYRSPGWIERDTDPNDNPASVTARMRMYRDARILEQQYGEDNARFLMPAMGDWLKHYRNVAFIDTGVGDVDEYRKQSRDYAAVRGWNYEELRGDSGLLTRMLDGQWDPGDFLVVPPGRTVRPSFRPDIIDME